MHTVSADPGKLWSWGDPSQLGKGQQARIPHIPGWGPPGGMAATGKAGAKNSTAAGEQVSSAPLFRPNPTAVSHTTPNSNFNRRLCKGSGAPGDQAAVPRATVHSSSGLRAADKTGAPLGPALG